MLRRLLALVLTTVPIATATADGPLESQLQAVARGARDRLPEPLLRTYQEAIGEVRGGGIEDTARQVGDDAPDATLTAWDGTEVTLSELWKSSPLILMWYRGGWCPYCNVQLREMQRRLDDIEGAGAKLAVLTPELPRHARATAEKNDLDLVALHDADLAVAEQYGIVFDLPPTIVPSYRDRLGLANYNGSDRMRLPLSATYVIDQNGKISYAFLDADYKKRAEPDAVIAAVRRIVDGEVANE